MSEVLTKALAEHGDAIKTFKDEVTEKQDELGARMSEMEQHVAKQLKTFSLADRSHVSPINVKSILEDPAFGRLRSANRGTQHSFALGPLSIKAMINASGGEPSSTNTLFSGPPEFFPTVLARPLIPTRALDVLPSRPVTANTVSYPQLDWSGDADVQDGEGAQKAEMEFTGDLKTANIVTVAVHTTTSAQVLDDVEELQNTIERVMRAKVANKIESEVITGSGIGNHVEGLYHQATSLISGETIPVERIGYAITLMDNAGYSVDVIFLNPTDYLNISLSKDTQGRYLFGNPASPAPPVLFNRRVVASPAIPLGHALVGDTTQTNVLDRMEPTVFISRDHLDYRTRNLVLILVETRVGFELYDKAAFRKLDISGPESTSA